MLRCFLFEFFLTKALRNFLKAISHRYYAKCLFQKRKVKVEKLIARLCL